MSNSTSQKNENLKLVANQLEKLNHQLTETDKLIKITSLQAQSIRKLGIYHSSLFMAVNHITEQDIQEQ